MSDKNYGCLLVVILMLGLPLFLLVFHPVLFVIGMIIVGALLIWFLIWFTAL